MLCCPLAAQRSVVCAVWCCPRVAQRSVGVDAPRGGHEPPAMSKVLESASRWRAPRSVLVMRCDCAPRAARVVVHLAAPLAPNNYWCRLRTSSHAVRVVPLHRAHRAPRTARVASLLLSLRSACVNAPKHPAHTVCSCYRTGHTPRSATR